MYATMELTFAEGTKWLIDEVEIDEKSPIRLAEIASEVFKGWRCTKIVENEDRYIECIGKALIYHPDHKKEAIHYLEAHIVIQSVGRQLDTAKLEIVSLLRKKP